MEVKGQQRGEEGGTWEKSWILFFLLFLLGNRWIDWSSYISRYCVIDAYCSPFSSFSTLLWDRLGRMALSL